MLYKIYIILDKYLQGYRSCSFKVYFCVYLLLCASLRLLHLKMLALCTVCITIRFQCVLSSTTQFLPYNAKLFLMSIHNMIQYLTKVNKSHALHAQTREKLYMCVQCSQVVYLVQKKLVALQVYNKFTCLVMVFELLNIDFMAQRLLQGSKIVCSKSAQLRTGSLSKNIKFETSRNLPLILEKVTHTASCMYCC